MAHQQEQADPDVSRVLLAGLTGIHPDQIYGYVILVANHECGVHLATDACCVFHALEQVLEAWQTEQDTLTPCSSDGY